jgi:hypothetical protein
MPQQSRAHHYVPQWYQRRFLAPGATNYFYLDLHPETVTQNGKTHQKTALLKWGPSQCFHVTDLYTLRFARKTSDEMEKIFFGMVDTRGHDAVETFRDYAGLSKRAIDDFKSLVGYMGAQRFRTPRGLDEIKRRAKVEGNSPNAALIALQRIFQAYGTMWTEGVWEFVRARKSRTKFIVSDNPVTFYCKVMFPSDWIYPNDPNLKQIGTRTIFPLGPDCCAIITHLQLARDPWSTPTEHRENARYYDETIKHLGDIQFGRELEEDEVRRINYILKRRATRYIAASHEEWLYPEKHVSITEWKDLDDDWFLLPHLWKVSFTSEIMMGGEGWAWGMDEYGRRAGHPNFRNKRMHERDWLTRQVAQREWAKKRAGKSFAQVERHEYGEVYDKMVEDFLRQEAGEIQQEKAST